MNSDIENEKSEVFEKLVRELNPIERKEFLEKLTSDKVVDPEPMIKAETENEEFDLEKEYYSLSLLTRLIIFFKTLFMGEDKFQLTEAIVLKRIEREIKKTAGNVLSYDKGIFTEELLEETGKLNDAVLFFRKVLSDAGGAARDEFLNFLGSLQIPIIHHQLMKDTDFDETEKRTRLTNPADVKREVLMNVDLNLDKITGDLRKIMYMHSKTIYIMGELVKYDFSEIESLFNKNSGQDKRTCYFGDIRNRLERLTELLAAFRVSPDKQLLEALFLFSNSSLRVDDEVKMSIGLKKFIDSAITNLGAIKNFNNKMQLTNIMKLVTGNIDYKPKSLSGGEDWFNLYSKYWHNLADTKFRKYSAKKRKQKIFNDMQMYFKKDDMPLLEFYRFTYKFSCGFLSLFLREQFTASMNDVLKKILVDGKFYKKQNKDDFTDAYSALLGLYEKIKKFDEKNAPKGEFGLKIKDIEQEMSSESSREKKKAVIIEMSDFEAHEIVNTGIEGLQKMRSVLYGILHGKAGGQYDSLSNLNKLITIESRDFIIDLNTVYANIEDASRLLGDIVTLEENG